MLSGEATNTNFIFFGLTRAGLEPKIYHTRGEYANYYATVAVSSGTLNANRLENKIILSAYAVFTQNNIAHLHAFNTCISSVSVCIRVIIVIAEIYFKLTLEYELHR